jgi:hypothetical protein
MKRFSIRDLLWLTAVIAILVAWWVSSRKPKGSWDHLRIEGIHDTRDEVLVHDTNSKYYEVWAVKQVGDLIPENEAYKWDRSK